MSGQKKTVLPSSQHGNHIVDWHTSEERGMGRLFEASIRPVRPRQDRWGLWRYDARNGFLVHKAETGGEYAVPRAHFADPRALADTLAQVSVQSWCTPGDLGNFVLAVDGVVGLRELARRA